jgi:hypothetical protein
MAFSSDSFDNLLFKQIGDTRATRTKDDDDVLQILQSLTKMPSMSKDCADPKKNAIDGLYVEAVQGAPRTFTLSADRTVDKDHLAKLAASYHEDGKLATTLLAFANDMGDEHAGNEELTKVMRELHRAAIPQIVAK